MKNLLNEILSKFFKKKQMSEEEFKKLTRYPEIPDFENTHFDNEYYLFLDDERNPVDVTWINNNLYKINEIWIIVRNYEQFKSSINYHGIPKLISFDHDLGEEKSGYDCAQWLVISDLRINEFIVHSKNPVGKENIESLLNNWKKFNEEIN